MRDVSSGFSNPKNVSPKILKALNGLAPQPELSQIAKTFVNLQQARHEADYDTASRFSRQEALDLIESAERAFEDWDAVAGSAQADAYLVALLIQKQMRV